MPASPETDPRRLTLDIPHLWDRDWETAINEASGADRFLVNVEARAAHLLKLIDDHSVTFERLAWLSMWTKCFSILEGARAAVAQNSQFLLELLSRTSFELTLHALTTLEDDFVNRLRAYAAWCLWNDRSFQKELLHPLTLKGIWNPQPAEDIAKDSNARGSHEKLFGPLDVETDYRKLREGRFRQQNEEQFRLHRLERWLDHPDLRTWRDRLLTLTGSSDHRQIAFFALFNESEASVAQRLRSLDMRFGYVSYLKGSMFVHGSTLEHTFLVDEGVLRPLFTGDNESVGALAQHVGRACNQVLVLLGFEQQTLWPRLA